MTNYESRNAAEDWGVVLQSVPSKSRKEIVKRLQEIFQLDREDAEQVLSNVPLILVDHVPFGVAVNIKKFFQKLGAVIETTNHEMIKKNCFQIVWPQPPDLAFFVKEEPSNVIPQEPVKKEEAPVAPVVQAETTVPQPEPFFEIQEVPPAPQAMPEPVKEETAPPVLPTPVPLAPAPFVPEEILPAENNIVPEVSSVDLEWERRARELNEKLQKIQNEKQQLSEHHAEVSEKVKNEFQQELDEERQKKEEIARAYEELQKEAQKQEALTREGEEWRSKAVGLGEKVRELETDLMQKSSAIEHLVQQKDALAREVEKAAELASRISDLEKSCEAKDSERTGLQGRIAELEGNLSESVRELGSSRAREQELTRKAEKLEHHIGSMEESLKSRDGALAQFEKQVLELVEKVQECDALRREHSQLVQERATIRKQYDAKLVEQEVRLAKLEEEHRRYRSRTDRKNAAATRELGEWVRGVDTVRQGLQKLILFLGSDSAVLDTEKKFQLRSPLTRGPDAPILPKD